MSKTYDAIIVGAGIIGCAIAFEMSKSGKKVLCIEKNAAAGSGSTSNSCAIIRTHYSTLYGAALAKSNYFFWENWAEYLEAKKNEKLATYREVGCLFTCFEKNQFGYKLEEIANKLNIPYEVWTPNKMKEKLPIINPGHFYPPKKIDDSNFGTKNGDMRYVLFFPKAGYVNDPMFATQNIQSAAERKNAHFIFGSKVTSINKSNGKVSGVSIDNNEKILAPVVVNASGPHSFKINEMAGVTDGMNIKTRALRVEVAHVPSPKDFDFEKDGYICSDDDISGYWRPEVGNRILIGSHENDCDPSEWVDPDNYNNQITEKSRLQAMRGAQRFPKMGIPNNVQGIADLYDVADDWIPIYDKSDLPGFYMAIGTSGNQFKNAPVAGKMMKEFIVYVESGNNHDTDPMQYQLPNINFKLDMSYCSRLREINQESSFSVVG